jgi:hypothetical protein
MDPMLPSVLSRELRCPMGPRAPTTRASYPAPLFLWTSDDPDLFRNQSMSLELATITFVAGIALGLRYRVVILLPVVVLAIIFALIGGIARGDPVWSIVLAAAISATAVQLGYLAGILLERLIAARSQSNLTEGSLRPAAISFLQSK